jgi:hypothetical protein
MKDLFLVVVFQPLGRLQLNGYWDTRFKTTLVEIL